MLVLALFALLIFVVFAVVGGLVVWYVIRNQSDDGSQPPRGVPRDYE